MARPDLPSGFGGWQVVDATPQETSQGVFRCGPTSVAAVRSGQTYLKYDTGFVFAEVNSDKVYWQRKTDGTFDVIRVDKSAVGHCISTKAVGSDKRVDITHLYKHPEGSSEERSAVEAACSFGSKRSVYSPTSASDVTLDVSMRGDGPCVGQDAELSILLKNNSSAPRSVDLYSQVTADKIVLKKDQTSVELKPHEARSLDWTLRYEEYQEKLRGQSALVLTLSGRVTETKQSLAKQFSFRLRTPDLIIAPVSDAVVGRELTVKIKFQNPLPRVLKDVVIRIEGLGMRNVKTTHYGDIAGHATMSLTETVVPNRPGSQKLLATLDCPQLTQVHGVANILVKDR